MKLFDSNDEWMDHAGCRDKPTEWWFSEQGNADQPPAGMRRALFTCWNKCEVRSECLQHAIDKPERYGIWGGSVQFDRATNKTREAIDTKARRRAESMRLVAREEKAS
jgi:WhiB family redox-sensing transcriptional regulator